ncbi:hypothetical protein G9A89_015042 [Geosiphon pyriformis]|nr:hypothetical protein G9A89_015042 [Geosiphon pyriformis]
MHPVDLPTTVTQIKDFEAAELEANHAQASHPSSSTNQPWQQKMRICHNCGKQDHFKADCYAYSNPQSGNQYWNSNRWFPTPNHYLNQNQYQTTYLPMMLPPIYQTPVYQLQPLIIYQLQPQIVYQLQQSIQTPPQNPATITFGNPRSKVTQNWRLAMKPLTHNIPPATSTEDESLAAIFPFELEEIMSVSLFSGTTLDTKPITTMYTDAKVDSQAASARIITADGITKTSIGEIDDFSFEVNGIIVPIKVLVIKATQYQALIDNNWLTKINTILDWTMQKLQLSQNSQHTCIPATCGHLKTINIPAPLIEFEKEEKKPTWEVYQVSWADSNHNELLPILSWDNNNNEKEKQREEHTWRTTINAWTDDN